MVRGFSYLVAVVDWFSRRVLSHRVSIMMEADCCVEVLEEALAKHGKPARAAITPLQLHHAAGHDLERLWRSVKYEEVFPRA